MLRALVTLTLIVVLVMLSGLAGYAVGARGGYYQAVYALCVWAEGEPLLCEVLTDSAEREDWYRNGPPDLDAPAMMGGET